MRSPLPSIKHKRDFSLVYKRGKRVATSMFTVLALQTDNETRLGVSVSKKVGKAPYRNRFKRLIKENCRLMDLKPGYDVVVSVKPTQECAFLLVKTDLEKSFSRLGILLLP